LLPFSAFSVLLLKLSATTCFPHQIGKIRQVEFSAAMINSAIIGENMLLLFFAVMSFLTCHAFWRDSVFYSVLLFKFRCNFLFLKAFKISYLKTKMLLFTTIFRIKGNVKAMLLLWTKVAKLFHY